MLQIQAELDREKQKQDPYFNLYSMKSTRNRNLCDPDKTELGAKNIDYEAAERIYKEQIIKRSERQTNFQRLFDKEIKAFTSRWLRFQRHLGQMQAGQIDASFLDGQEAAVSQFAHQEEGIENKMIGRFSRVNYE